MFDPRHYPEESNYYKRIRQQEEREDRIETILVCTFIALLITSSIVVSILLRT